MRCKRWIPELCRATAPSGREEAARRVIREALKELLPRAIAVEEDPLGSILVHAGGDDRAGRAGRGAEDQAGGTGRNGGLLLAAALDEPPFLVTHVDPGGYLRFHSPVRIPPEQLVGAEVRFLTGRPSAAAAPAVSGLIVVEERRREERNKLEYHHLVIDAGFRSEEEALRSIRPGALGALYADFRAVGSRWAGKSLHRAGAAALLEAAAEALQGNRSARFSLLFAAQSALGGRGARVAGQRQQPEAAVVVTASPARDLPGAREGGIRLGGGPVIRYLDRSMVGSAALALRLTELAKELSLPYQVEVSSEGPILSDALQILISGAGVPAAVVALPLRHHDQSTQMIDPDDVAALARLLQAVLARGMPL